MSGDYFVSVDVLKSIPSFDASKVNATQDGFVSLNSLRNAGIEVREMLDFNKIQIANYSPGDNITLSKANPNDYFTELNKNLNN